MRCVLGDYVGLLLFLGIDLHVINSTLKTVCFLGQLFLEFIHLFYGFSHFVVSFA